MRSRLPERLVPAGRSRSRSGMADAVAIVRSRPCAGRTYALNDWPQPQVDVAFGFLIVKPPPVIVSTKSTSAPFR